MKKSQEELTASLILNTKRNKRLNNLIEIAEDIEALSQETGGIEKVAGLIGISTHMLNQFLSVRKLSEKVREKIATRELDSVSVVNYITKYNENDQEYLAENYVSGYLNSQDIRTLGPLRTKFPETPIDTLAEKVIKSKNIKVSVFYVQLPFEMNSVSLTDKIMKVVGEDNIISIEAKGFLGIIKLTKEGEVLLKKKSKRRSLKTYLSEYLKNSQNGDRSSAVA